MRTLTALADMGPHTLKGRPKAEQGSRGSRSASVSSRCLSDPVHPVPHHRWHAPVLHGAGSGPVQPGRGSHRVEDLPVFQR